MILHKEKELFDQVVIRASEQLGISETIIEKDYYVTYVLKELIKKEPNIIFKGGTSLSKCYKLIERFSEDVDLNYKQDVETLTDKGRKELSNKVIHVIEKCEMELGNENEIKSRAKYNKYVIKYNAQHSLEIIKDHVIIEISLFIDSFPTVPLAADCYIYQYLKDHNEEIIEQYQLQPFTVNVQTMERTFIDKVFAICDYYLHGEMREHSRHLYDLYKLYPGIVWDKKFQDLVEEVRVVRRENKTCDSAKAGCSVTNIIHEIIQNKVYENDYTTITQHLLFEDVSYEQCIVILEEIKYKNIF